MNWSFLLIFCTAILSVIGEMARGKTDDVHEVLALSWNVQGNSVVRNELLNAHLPFSNKTDIVVLSLQEIPFGTIKCHFFVSMAHAN